MENEPEWITVTTFTQAKYYLEQGYTIAFKLMDNTTEGFIKKENENQASIIIQPKYGSSDKYIGDYDKLEAMMDGFNIDWEFWTIKGWYSSSRPNDWKDKIADFINKK